MSGVPERDAGLASGLVNTAQPLSRAHSLAVLASVAASRTEGLAGAGSEPVIAINGGYHAAFLLSAIFVALAAVLAAALLRLTEDGKEAGASGAGRTVDMPTDAPTNNGKLPEQ